MLEGKFEPPTSILWVHNLHNSSSMPYSFISLQWTCPKDEQEGCPVQSPTQDFLWQCLNVCRWFWAPRLHLVSAESKWLHLYAAFIFSFLFRRPLPLFSNVNIQDKGSCKSEYNAPDDGADDTLYVTLNLDYHYHRMTVFLAWIPLSSQSPFKMIQKALVKSYLWLITCHLLPLISKVWKTMDPMPLLLKYTKIHFLPSMEFITICLFSSKHIP